MERYEGIDFHKRRYNLFSFVNTSSMVSVGGVGCAGETRSTSTASNPFLGRETSFRSFITVRPVSRFSSEINVTTSRFTDPQRYFVPRSQRG